MSVFEEEDTLSTIAWPFERVGEAIEALGRATNLVESSGRLEVPAPPRGLDEDAFSRWVATTAAWLGLEAEPVEAPYAEVPSLVRGASPALLRLGDGEGAPFVALLRTDRGTATVLDPTRAARRVPARAIVRALRRPLEEHVTVIVEAILAHVPERRRERAREALLREHLGARRTGSVWLLRAPPSTRLGQLARVAKLPRLLALLVTSRVVEYVLVLLSWLAAGKGAFEGRFDAGWLACWALLLVSLIPFRLLGAWATSRFSIGAGTLLKTRLLMGALRLDPNAIRHQGSGQLLGRVIESSAVEMLGVTGGLASVIAIVEVLMCAVVLAQGAGSALHVALYLACAALIAFVCWRYYLRLRHWTKVRLSMTHDLVERMVGHRTRVAQEPRSRWHDGEDQMLEQYLVGSRDLDRTSTALFMIPRCWLLLGIAALAPELVRGNPSTLPLAVALGGILLGYGSLASLASGVAHASAAAIAWHEARPLVHAAAAVRTARAPTAAATTESAARTPEGAVLLHAEDLRFRHRERGELVLRGCSLRVRAGDRVLLEGPSGGGKSTLGSILTGLRVPESGLLLIGGLDRHTLGDDGWRHRVVAAPQFHENHVFSATVAFNLLMGRAWPPAPDDLEEAEKICRELDLGDVLDRMPAGLQQVLGETGWQLSHGEKSRVYIARALLQNSDLVVLDESFAALDPETLQRVLKCVLERSRTLLVIAHP